MLQRILKSVMFKPTSFFLAFMMLMLSVQTPAQAQTTKQKATIKAGTIVQLESIDAITSKSVNNGQVVSFKVLSDVMVDGKVAIAAGSIALGQISRVKKSGICGIPGEVTVAVKSVTATDGTVSPLMGANMSDEGSNNVIAAVLLTFLCFFGFLIKGGKAEIPSGTFLQATVMSNVDVVV